jgi:dihydroxy-acid dehydratase
VATGRRAVELARSGDAPSRALTPAAFANAQVVLAAIGGSTNAVIHLLAIASRAGVSLTLDSFDEMSQRVPVLVDCKPVGSGYLEDLHESGGVPALLAMLGPLLDPSAWRVDGRTIGATLSNAVPPHGSALRGLDNPVVAAAAFAVVRGTLAPDGGLIKVAAASAHLLRHRGPAFVIDSPEEAVRRLDDPAVAVTANHIVVLRNAGPVACGMPEAGSAAIPTRLAKQGVRDMVRVSDGRMSGTAFGTTVLHCSPEAATGGPLALVRDGDLIDLDVDARRLDLLVDGAELDRRRATLTLPEPPPRGWLRLHHDHVLPAHLGADLDFLSGRAQSSAT